jgi:hypothetical protein
MSRPEKTAVAAKRRHVILPMDQTMDHRGLAKHLIQHRGGWLPMTRKVPPRKGSR